MRTRTLLRKNALAAARRSLKGEQLLVVMRRNARVTVQRLAPAGVTELNLQNHRHTFNDFALTVKLFNVNEIK